MNHHDEAGARLSALVAELEEVCLDVEGITLEALTEGLERRQKILDEIQEADARAVLPESRRLLNARLEQVRGRDAQVVASLVRQHAEIAEALGESGKARVAARGYGSTGVSTETRARRTA